MFAVLTFSLILAVGVNGLDETEWKYAIISATKAYSEALTAKDFGALEELLTEDVTFMPFGMPKLVGRPNITDLYHTINRIGRWPKSFKIQLDHLRWTCGNTALSEEVIEQTGFDDSIFKGKAVRLYREDNGGIKIAMSIWNSD